MSQTRIFVTFQVEGVHSWPDAPHEHAYLRSPHRHMFHVRVEVWVPSPDRAIEFIEFKRICAARFLDLSRTEYCGIPDFGARSCEHLAIEFLHMLQKHYGIKDVQSVEVSEDGENGAIVTA